MARLSPLVAVLAALLIGYMAHDLAGSPAQASVPLARGASSAQLASINRKLAALTTQLAQVTQDLGGRGAQGLGIAPVLDQVNSALGNTVKPDVLTTCLAVLQPSGQQANCRP